MTNALFKIRCTLPTKGILLVIGMIMLFINPVHSGIETQSTGLTGAQIADYAVVDVKDNKYGLTGYSSIVKSSNARLILLINPYYSSPITGSSITFQVQMSVTTYTLSGSPSVSSVTLNIDYNSTSSYTDYNIKQYSSVHKLVATITNISVNGSKVTNLSSYGYVQLKAEIETERFLQPSNLTSLTDAEIDDEYISSSDELEIDWAFMKGAEHYELEYAYIDDYDTYKDGLISYLGKSDLDFNFDSISTRIVTHNNYYRLSMAFDHGYLVYRIRGVGRSPNNTDRIYAGPWSNNSVASGKVSEIEQIFEISENYSHQSAKVWQYTASFAEYGLKKENIDYIDGSYRKRQRVTRSNTTEDVLVQETIYDYLGRPAIEVLPAPRIGSTKLDYYPDFNRNSSEDAYSWRDFDKDQNTNKQMSTGDGTTKYFDVEQSAMPYYQDYLPKSFGYPFSQVEYTPDRTLRIRRQGSVGETFQLSDDGIAGHEMRYYYGQPDQEQLDMMFGSEVGFVDLYKKNLVIDANQQVSVTYLDPAGRTIASCLAGDAPDNLNSIAVDPESITTYYLKNDATILNYNIIEDDRSLVYTKQIMVSYPTEYGFEYDLETPMYDDNCMTENYCFDCIYDLYLSLKNENGTELFNTGSGINTPVGDESLNNQCGTYSGAESPEIALTAVGSYALLKKLTLNEQALSYYTDLYMDTAVQINACLPSLKDMINQALAAIDTSDCNIPCTTCYSNGSVTSSLLPVLLSDMLPGNQYAEYETIAGNITADYKPLSVLNEENSFPEPDYNWRHPAEVYKDENGNDSYIILELIGSVYYPEVADGCSIVQVYRDSGGVLHECTSNCPPDAMPAIRPECLANLGDFVSRFKGSWTYSLVEYHPEYNYYKWYDEKNANTLLLNDNKEYNSDQYDSLLYALQTYVDALVYFPYLDNVSIPLDLLDTDPFFDGLNPYGYPSYTYFSSKLGTYQMLADPQCSTSYSLNIKHFVGYVTGCSSYEPCVNPVNQGCYIAFGSGNNDMDNLQWKLYRDLYMIQKKMIQSKAVHEYLASDNSISGDVDHDGYNGCIENADFDPYVQGQYDFDNGVDQPCNDAFEEYYSEKQKRYYGTDMPGLDINWDEATAQDVIALLHDYINEHLWESLELCPDDMQLGSLLNALAKEDQLDALSVDLNLYPEFDEKLKENLGGTYSDYTWIATPVPNLDKLIIEIKGDQTQISLGYLYSPFDLEGFAWDNITSLFNLQYIKSDPQLGDYLFRISALYGSGALSRQIMIYGSSEIKLNDCEPEVVTGCEDICLEETFDILNTLAANGDIGETDVPVALGNIEDCIEPSTNCYYLFNEAEVRLEIFGQNRQFQDYRRIYYFPINPPVDFAIEKIELFKEWRPAIINGKYVCLVTVEYNTTLPEDETDLFLTFYTDKSYLSFDNEEALSRIYNCGCPGNTTAEFSNLLDTLVYLDVFTYPPSSKYCNLKNLPDFNNNLMGQCAINYYDRCYWQNQDDPTVQGNSLTCVIYKDTPTSQIYYGCIQELIDNEVATITFSTSNSEEIYFSQIEYFENLFLVDDDATPPVHNFIVTAVMQDESSVELTGETTFDLYGWPCYSECGRVFAGTWDQCSQEYNSLCSIFTSNTELFIDTLEKYCARDFSLGREKYLEYIELVDDAFDIDLIQLAEPMTNVCFISLGSFTELGLFLHQDEYEEFINEIKNIHLDCLSVPTNFDPETSPYFMTLDDFVAGRYYSCLESYKLYLDNFCISYDDPLTLQDYTYQQACGHTLVSQCPYLPYNPQVSPPAPWDMSCQTAMMNQAIMNATLRYQYMMDSIRQKFISDYVTTCLAAQEKFSATYDDKEYQFTLYYYDQAGNLIKTVPPEGVHRITDPNDLDQIKANRLDPLNELAVYPEHSFITGYSYNSLNQVLESTTPDAGTSLLWYDELGRIRFSQNAQQQTDECFSYTKYDELGRIVETGKSTQTVNGQLLVEVVNNQILNDNSLPDDDNTQVTTTVYDVSTTTAFGTNGQKNLRSRIAGVRYDHDGDQTLEHATHYSYDIHGNVKSMIQELPDLAAMNQRYKRADYRYDLISGNVLQLDYQNGLYDQFYHRYEYDADNRLTNVYTSTNLATWDEEARYSYYRHGPLARVELGTRKVQGLDYAYTLQGWIKGMNSSTLRSNRDIGRDNYWQTSPNNLHRYIGIDTCGYMLGYYDDDYTSVKSFTDSEYFIAKNYESPFGLYNGNISSMVTSLSETGQTTQIVPLLYQFKYDQLNRINTANAFVCDDVKQQNDWDDKYSDNSEYFSKFSYDKNGNIVTLIRNGDDNLAAMDSLTYTYYDDKNQLKRVVDDVSAGNYPDDIDSQAEVVNYEYDANGNLVKDHSEEINSITWTNAGKIQGITRDNNSSKPALEFAYDGLGNRVKKEVITGTVNESTWYVQDAQGNILAIYQKDGEDNLAVTERPIYGSSRLGVLITELESGTTSSLLSHTTGDRHYELTNHLGNVLATVSDRKIIEQTPYYTYKHKPEVKSVQDYYAFGMLMPGRQSSILDYRFGYIGVEKDDEWSGVSGSHYDHKYRSYDSRIGRYKSIDPLSANYPWNSTYAYAENRVLEGIDLEGLEWSSKTINGKEEFTCKIQVYNYSKISSDNDVKLYLSNIEEGIENVFSKNFESFHSALDIIFEFKGNSMPDGGWADNYKGFSMRIWDLNLPKETDTYMAAKTSRLPRFNSQINIIDFYLNVTKNDISNKVPFSKGIRYMSHELGHTASLEHPWKETIDDINQNLMNKTNLIKERIKLNLMNSAENPIPYLRMFQGTEITPGQLQKISSNVNYDQTMIKKLEPIRISEIPNEE